MDNPKLWSTYPLQKVAGHFEVDTRRGLSEEEALRRQRTWGLNRMASKKGKGAARIFLAQFKDFLVLVLLFATLISGLLKEYSDAITIIVIVIFNAVLGFVQEYRAERSFEALKRLTVPVSRIIRNGRETECPAEKVVPGDLLSLQAGDRVSADVRLFHAEGLRVDESALTGEPEPANKTVPPLKELPASPGDAGNMLFNGTLVTAGYGKGIVVATGERTELGKIASLIQEAGETATPLQKRLARVGKILLTACLALCLLVVLLGLMRGEDIYLMLMAGVSLAVAAIPEGLPAIVTVSLALGVQRMVKRKTIVRRLPAVETLGCATVICSDKTGTLTQGKMAVKRIFTADGDWELKTGQRNSGLYKGQVRANIRKEPSLWSALQIAVFCNNAVVAAESQKNSGEDSFRGDPTEVALLYCAGAAGVDGVEQKLSRVKEYPFTSDRKRMSVVVQQRGRLLAAVKGAPEGILQRCSYLLENGREKPLDEKKKRELLTQLHGMTGGGMRVLATAYRYLPSFSGDFGPEEIEKELVFSGLFGLTDPPRQNVLHAVKRCLKAGIRVVMITGDHPQTAAAVGKELGILTSSSHILTGTELDELGESEFLYKADKIEVFARVTPEHKLRIVRGLKSKGHVVAMTGDGVNDAPAVKEADIGIAMGSTGTEVTKEAASLVLVDDNFSTIVAAVEEGRNIYENIRKFIRFLLGCNLGEILTVLVAMLCGFPLPLRPIQILWVNLVTDGLPAMALGVDPPEEDMMTRPPRSPREGIFHRGLWRKIMYKGTLIGFSTAGVFALALWGTSDLLYAQTMALSTLVVTQLAHVFECRAEGLPFWEINLGKNLLLVGAVTVSFLMLLLIIYVPFFQSIFSTVGLNIGDWLFIFLISFLPYGLQYAARPGRAKGRIGKKTAAQMAKRSS